ncbi:MAG: hypothetical protein JSU73_07500 [candidate division WOR-3 bacterium]|nr:MAG: hypothetical protein JSU73_07500 [candidate division WOR-3 bacterium]
MLRATAILATCVALLLAYSDGPPDSKTGRPGEGTCADCHSGTASGDSSALAGLPGALYYPESTYILTLGLRYAGQTRWGFELTAVDESGRAAGELFVTDSVNTQLSASGGRQYLKQTSAGTQRGRPDAASWQFGWHAPTAGSGPITFYWSGNACDGNGSSEGDFAVPSNLTVTEAAAIEEDPGTDRYQWYYESPGQNRVVIRYAGDPQQPVKVYSSDGRLVRILTPVPEGEVLRADWDGTDRSGEPVPEASYFVLLDQERSGSVKIDLVR